MPRPGLDHGIRPSMPSAKFPEVGAALRGALVEIVDVQERVFGTSDPASWPDGAPKMQKKLTLVVIKHRGVDFGDHHRDPEVTALYVNGPRVKELRDAAIAYRREHGEPPGVGTVLTAQFVEERESKRKGNRPVKWFKYTYSPETPALKEFCDRAEAEWRALQERATTVAQAAQATSSIPVYDPMEQVYDDEEAF